MEQPAMNRIENPCSSSARMTPMWAWPRAPPLPSTSEMFLRAGIDHLSAPVFRRPGARLGY